MDVDVVEREGFYFRAAQGRPSRLARVARANTARIRQGTWSGWMAEDLLEPAPMA